MKTFRKTAALLLCLVMVLSLIPTGAFAWEEERAEPMNPEPNYGLINQYHYGTTAVTDAYLRGETLELNGVTVGQPVRDLPSSWDSRNYNWITSVKNQQHGDCWAHAAMGSVEGYMISHNVPVGTGAAATTSLNLSETQHGWFNYTNAYDAEGMLTGDKSTPQDSCLEQGGNGEMSAYTLLRWTGAASETTSALAYSRHSTVNSSGLDSQYAYGANVCHVQNSVWIPGTNIDAIKQAIMDHGAGNISYYESQGAYTYTCTIDTSSQDSSSHKWSNHAITLVGWDDTIAASKFSPNKPSKPGAWLCKNSWGTSQFNQGYMYISYEDTSVLEGYIYFYDAEPIDNYSHNYQYDGTCNVVCFGKGWPSGQDYYLGFENNTQVANVFTAKGNEVLRAVALCNWDEGMTYTVEIYKNPSTGNPSSGTLMSTQTGYLEFSGYYTIPLNTPVSLAAGDSFAVVITQNVPVADEDGTYVHTPYDASFDNSDVVSWCSWNHANHGNTSYYKEPNGSWTDCPDNGDYRIKAYTDDVLFNLSAVSNNTAWGTVKVDGSTIVATPANGYYVESCQVLSGSATYTINGNSISVSATEDCTIQVNFAPKPSCTVSFVASGVEEGSQTALVNDVITLPASVSVNPQGWTFTGWTTQQIDETADKPDFYAPGASYTVTGNVTLFALYSRLEEGSGEVIYQLAESFENGKKYILVSDASISNSAGYAVGNTAAASNHYLSGVSVSINGDLCTASEANLSKVLWTATSVSNGYTLYNEAVGKYMGLDSTEYIYPSTTALAWVYTSDGYLDNQSDSEGYYYLSFDSSNQRYTTSKSGNVIKLYQETNDSITYYWTDPEEIIPEEHTVSFSTPEGITSPASMVMDNITGGTLPTAEAPEGYTFLGWVLEDYDNVTEQPADILTGNYKPQADVTLKALYTYSVAGGTAPTLVQMTVNDSFADGDRIVITALDNTDVDNEIHYGLYQKTYNSTYVDRYLFNHDVETILADDKNYLNVTAASNGWYLGDDANGWLYTSGSNNLAINNSSKTVWTLTTLNGALALKGNNRYLSFRSDLSSKYWRMGGSAGTSGQCQLIIYKLTDGTSYTAYYTTLIPSSSHVFSDVTDPTSYYYEPVKWAVEHEITNGVSETSFGVNQACTRAQVVTFLYRAAGSPIVPESEIGFEDVSEGAWYHDAVLWAVQNEITTGTSDTSFSPNQPCTRAQAVTFLWRAAKLDPNYQPPTGEELSFTDVPAAAYYREAVLWALQNGITTGTSAASFSPNSIVSRAQMVTFLWRYMK